MSREKGTKRKTQNERKNLFGRFINRLRSTELCVPKLGQKRALYCGPGINRLDEIKCDKDKSRVFAAERAKTFHIRVGMRVKRKVLDMVWALNCTKNHSSEDTNEHGLEVSNRSEIDSPPATPTSPTLQHGIVTYVMDEGTLYFVGRNDSKNVENVFKRLKEKNDCRVGDICFAKHPVADKFCRDRIIHIDPTKPLHKVIKHINLYRSIKKSQNFNNRSHFSSITYRQIT